MTTPEQIELDTKTCTALGRFVVAFSSLLYALETSTVQLITPAPDGRRMTLLSAALADRTAAPIVTSFFAVFHKHWEGSLTEEDLKILKALRRELDDLIKERNRLMHDAWMSSTVGGDPGPHAMSRFRVRAHGAGVEYGSVSYPPDMLDDLSRETSRLASIVNGAVWYHRPGQSGPELHLRMNVVDRKVVRIDS